MNNNMTIIENNKEFIPVYRTEQGTEVVRGRELHKGLNVKQDFSDWIKKQLKNIEAIDNKDYYTFWYKNDDPFKKVVEFKGNINSMVRNGNSIEYIIKLETAKEICLIAGASPRANKELKEKSKAYRRYLISVEEKCKNEIINGNIRLDDKIIRKMFMQDEKSRTQLLDAICKNPYNLDIVLNENPKTEISTIDNTELLRMIKIQSDLIKYQGNMIKRQDNNINELTKIVKDLSNKIDDLNKKSKFITTNNNDITIINITNLNKFKNYLNGLDDNVIMSKKEYIKLFNEYEFYHKKIGIMLFNKFMVEQEEFLASERLTSKNKKGNLFLYERTKDKNYNTICMTKKGLLYVTNLIVDNMGYYYK